MGNIAEVRENGILAVKYTYDTLSRIIREDNRQRSETVLYTYDNCGNILSKRTCAFTLEKSDKIIDFTEKKDMCTTEINC